MKKLLAFLVLFAGGLAIVYWLDRRYATEDTPLAQNAGDIQPLSTPEGSSSGINMRGAFRADLYDEATGNVTLQVESEDSRTADSADELTRVTIIVKDPSADESVTLGTINAQTARLPRREGGGIHPSYLNKVYLTEVVGHFDKGLPVSPLDFTTPAATIDASLTTHFVLTEEAPIRIESPEFDAGADSYRIDIVRPNHEAADDADAVAASGGKAEVIDLRTNPWLEFRRTAERGSNSADLRSARIESLDGGSIQVRRQGSDNPQSIEFEVDRRGRLQLFGVETSTLEGDHLFMIGSALDAAEVIEPERVELEGDVVWTSGNNVFTAKECEIDFKAGEFAHARLTDGLPTLRVALDLDAEQLANLTANSDADAASFETLRIVSQKEIELSREPGLWNYRIAGPGTLDTGGFNLRSNGELAGYRTDAGNELSFSGTGGVFIEATNATVEAADFEVTLVIDDAGEQTLSGVASGGARLAGQLEDGRAFTVTTPDRLAFERIGGKLRIVEGFGVEVSVEGDNGFFARCNHLVDLRVDAMSFFAEGDVVFRSKDDEAFCERLESKGEGRYTLWGTDETRAVFVSPLGRGEALFVEIDGERLHARGRVDAKLFSLPDGATFGNSNFEASDLSCGDLVFTRAFEIRDDKSVVRRFHLEAKDGVRMRLGADEKTIELRSADAVTADRFDHRSSKATDASRIASNTDMLARGNVVAHLALGATKTTSDIDVFCDSLDVTHAAQGRARGEQSMLARGNVRFEGTGQIDFAGAGDRLRVDADETAHLEANDGERIQLSGSLPSQKLPFRMTALRADFTSERIDALDPDIHVTKRSKAKGEDDTKYRATARSLVATNRSLELIQDVHFNGANKAGVPWTMDARRVVLEGRGTDDGAATELSRINATGGVTFRLGDTISAKAQSLFGVGPSGVLRLTGNPTTIESPTGSLDADWVDIDPELQIILETGRGRFRRQPPKLPQGKREGDGAQSGPGAAQDGAQVEDDWSLDFLWTTMRVDRDSHVFFMQEPVFRHNSTQTTLRASWAVLWLDRSRYDQLTSGNQITPPDALKGADQNAVGPLGVFFEFIKNNAVAGVVSEAYFEGPVQVFQNDVRVATAEAIYFDLTSGHGWFADTTINLSNTEVETLSVRANWLRHSADGSLRADNATLTSCDFEEPHVCIVTGDLRMTPLSNELDGRYQVTMRDNRIELYGMAPIPLPPLDFETDEELVPQFPSLSFGNTARVGQFFGLRFSGPARNVGRFVNRLWPFGGDEDEEDEADATPSPATDAEGGAPSPLPTKPKKKPKKKRPYDARYDVDAKYLGSRGALVDLGLTYKSTRRVWFEFITGVAFDSDEDRGYIRVPESERDNQRFWLRSHGEVLLGSTSADWDAAPNPRPRRDERIVVTYSDQSDPGVQSEFFESEFVQYERDETYVQWKRSNGHLFTDVAVSTRTDEFRAAVEELPSASAFRGRAPIARIGNVSIIHTGDLNAGYLRRRSPSLFDLDGDNINDGTLTGPFAPTGVYPDGTENREVVRVDTTQTIEAPLMLGAAGLKLTPFLSLRGTAWDEASDQNSATRVVAEAGARLSTSFWHRRPGGELDQIAPYLQVRTELDSEFDGSPYVFDAAETTLFGDFLEIGTRARFGITDEGPALDLDLRGVHASDRSDGARDGWLPLAVYGRARFKQFGRSLDVWYDGRYDSEASEVVYSLFSIGTRFADKAGVQLSHHYGRDDTFVKIFDAATIAGFYRWTEKWEFEARQSFSILAETRLGTSVLLRRYGHDIIFELETQVREGEGSSVNFSVSPRLQFRPSRIGYTNW